MKDHNRTLVRLLLAGSAMCAGVGAVTAQDNGGLAENPMRLSSNEPPLTMLVLGRNHKLYYEAYNDASDLNGDGRLDTRYKPDEIDYYGYFDSFKCYTYSSGLFSPSSETADKTCGSGWSGDFLNYLTTSRMDALRKVLYGGYRATDGTSDTVLERAFIPQDGHSWGKEYHSVEHDGYAIGDYTPLGQPVTGTRHLFANTTLGYGEPPLLRVLTDSQFRIWEWVSIERPVAGSECSNENGRRLCDSTDDGWTTVPEEVFGELTQTAYPNPNNGAHPQNAEDFTTLEDALGQPDGSRDARVIHGSGNPFVASDDDYVTIFEGTLTVPEAGSYEFRVKGDDAVDFLILDPVSGDWEVIAGCYGGHGEDECDDRTEATGSFYLQANTPYRIKYRHEDYKYGDAYRLFWDTGANPELTDYAVRVAVCADGLLEGNCTAYGDSGSQVYKPTGLLHEFGENDRMLFGLMSGSYGNNLRGGVLRRNVGSFSGEIDPATGQFVDGSDGIYDTINALRVTTFNFSDIEPVYDCGWDFAASPLTNGNCREWGNPIGEMMYEATRYFAGRGSPTSLFSSGAGGELGLPEPGWDDPYADGSAAREAGAAECSKPFNLVISDVNPSYDSDQVPGSAFSSFSGDLAGLNVSSLLDTISDGEDGIPGTYFVGEAGGVYDGTPSAKSVSSLADTRGLPEEPTKEGSFSSAAVAYYGNTRAVDEEVLASDLQTFSIALASPLPRIRIPVGEDAVTLVPFAKSVGDGNGDITSEEGGYQPTDQIVDFYIDEIFNAPGFPDDASVNDGAPYYRFRINFQDVEEGADHDMDAVVIYEVRVVGDRVEVNLETDYARGSIIQHLGYVISGVENPGPYLEVRDTDTPPGNDPDYFLDTPEGELPGGNWDDGEALPLSTSRTFTPSGEGANQLESPLWYAAKWGGFIDSNDNERPDPAEWDTDGDGTPDSFFLVTNPTRLKAKLRTAFRRILQLTSNTGSLEVSRRTLASDTRLFSASFNSEEWTGDVMAFGFRIDADGDAVLGSADWRASDALDALPANGWDSGRRIVTANSPTVGVPFRWPATVDVPENCAVVEPGSDDLNAAQIAALSRAPGAENCDDLGDERLQYLRGRTVDGFRERESLLGDIVRSEPMFVGNGFFHYPEDWDPESAYSVFRDDVAGFGDDDDSDGRAGVVYVGANDGMLHAFRATDGKELFGYVPRGVYEDLSSLPALGYGGALVHRAFVDAPVTYVDAYVDGDWESVLTGGLGPGGKGVYALEVTDVPSLTTSEDDLADQVILDLTGSDHPLLGHVYAPPNVVRLSNGEWAALFGNGFEEDTEGEAESQAPLASASDDGDTRDQPALFLVELDSASGGIGSRLTVVEAGNEAEGNGLSAVAPVDVNGDSIVDFAYAGDHQGNLYRFDLTEPGSITPEMIFESTTAQSQPITGRPVVGLHPSGRTNGVIVYFGTGSYAYTDDNADKGVQSFYAVWDKTASADFSGGSNFPLTRDDLAAREITHESGFSNSEGDSFVAPNRLTSLAGDFSWNYQDKKSGSTNGYYGWYLDLIPPAADTGTGERVVSQPSLTGSLVRFSTVIPVSDAAECTVGDVAGWDMALNRYTGGPPGTAPFDNDGDGLRNDRDLANLGEDSNRHTSGKQRRVDEVKPQRSVEVVDPETGRIQRCSNTENGINCETVDSTAYGRQSWRQLR